MNAKLRLALAAAIAIAASPVLAAGWDSQGYPDRSFSGQDGSSYYGADGAYNRYCPPGAIPESFPNGNGVRCTYPNGNHSY